MLDIAGKYEDELKLLFANIIFEEKYKYLYYSSYRDKFKCAESTWNAHEFVSMKDNKIIGYIKYYIDRDSMIANSLQIVNFTNDKLTFGLDLVKCLDEIFTKFNFRKLKYSVIIGNPIENTYDRLTKKYGGEIVGIRKEDIKLLDGKYYDMKMYEIFKEDYLASNSQFGERKE